jgi:hypothetical protein
VDEYVFGMWRVWLLLALTDDGGGHTLIEVEDEPESQIAVVVDGLDGKKVALVYQRVARIVRDGATTYYLVDAEVEG